MPENCSRDCFDSICYAVLKYFGYEYEIYNIKYFYTNYYFISNNELVFKRENKYYKNILKEIYNIDIKFIKRNQKKDLLKTIQKLIAKSPVGIFIDPYYCEWTLFYQKAHQNHTLLIIDINYEKQKYICFDMYYPETGYLEIDFDFINRYYLKYFWFRFKKCKTININYLLNKVNTILNNFNDHLDDKKKEIIDAINNRMNNLLNQASLDTATNIVNLANIADDRLHFSIFLQYIENKLSKNIFTPLYNLLANSREEFMILKALLTKYGMTGVINAQFLNDSVTRILDIDKMIVETMKNSLKEVIRT